MSNSSRRRAHVARRPPPRFGTAQLLRGARPQSAIGQALIRVSEDAYTAYPSTSVLKPPETMRFISKGILGIGCDIISFMIFLFTAFRWALDL